MDGSGMQQQGVFGFAMPPGQGWNGGNGLPPGTNMQQMHGSPGGYHPQNVGMAHQPLGNAMDHPHSPVGVGINVTSNHMDPLEHILGVFPCAKLRGLPFEASAEDVLVFFQGLVVLDVVVLNRGNGKGSGEAYVVFANPMDFQMALQRDRQNMGRRYIEVFQGKRSEYYAAIVQQHQNISGHNQHHHQQHHQQQHQHNNGNGNGEKRNNSSPSSAGTASDSNKGPTPAQAQAMAMGVPHPPGTVPGPPPGPVNQNENRGKNKGGSSGNKGGRGSFASGGGGGGGSGSGSEAAKEPTGYLRMRGLPFSATKKDIFEFFKEYKPVEDSIVLSYRSDGRATGEGYLSFETPEDSKEAMTLHRKLMGSRYIELFISSKDEHRRMVQRAGSR